MRLITRFRLWIWHWRRRRAFTNRKGELREFVYLDEVSVYSLIASRLGPIAAEFTETQAKTLEREFSGSFSADSGVVKGEWGPRRLDIQTRGSQVLRKSTVQTTFKEFYEFEMDALGFKPLSDDAKLPTIHSLADLIEATKILEDGGWIVDPGKLSRGQLLEVEVKLEAESIYHVSTLISAFLEIFEEARNISDLGSYDFIQVREIEHILTKLLVGLVPVRGQAIDYKIVVLEEKEWIVHRKLLKEIPTNELLNPHPLFVVGVAEQSLFWKDIRRTLFSAARFRVFCRMSQDGLQNSWTPVKLAQVLDTIVPGLADQIDAIGKSAFTSMTASPSNQSLEKQQRMRNALNGYAKLLADHYNQDISPQDLSEIDQISQGNSSLYDSQKERLEAFEGIATHLLVRFGIEREPEIIANNRELALNNAGLDFSGQLIPLGTPNKPLLVTPSEQRFLDTEFIAIYW